MTFPEAFAIACMAVACIAAFTAPIIAELLRNRDD